MFVPRVDIFLAEAIVYIIRIGQEKLGNVLLRFS